MATCVYDNPQTQAREVWVKGKRTASVSAIAIMRHLPHFDKWSPGRIWGDPIALQLEEPGYGHGV
jgi:hypothetical protein